MRRTSDWHDCRGRRGRNFQLLCHASSTQVILLGRNSYIKVFIDHGYKQVSKIGIFHVNFVPASSYMLSIIYVLESSVHTVVCVTNKSTLGV